MLLIYSYFTFLDWVKAILEHCAHRLLSESTRILCTLRKGARGKQTPGDFTRLRSIPEPHAFLRSVDFSRCVGNQRRYNRFNSSTWTDLPRKQLQTTLESALTRIKTNAKTNQFSVAARKAVREYRLARLGSPSPSRSHIGRRGAPDRISAVDC